MNFSVFSGPISGKLFFQWLHPEERKHAYLRFYVKVRGVGQDADQYPQISIYGEKAQNLFRKLRPGMWVEVQGRYRKRKDLKGRIQHEFVASRVEYVTLRYLVPEEEYQRFVEYCDLQSRYEVLEEACDIPETAWLEEDVTVLEEVR